MGKSMIFGDRNNFAIDLAPGIAVGKWLFGTFTFWANGLQIGDPSDHSVHLRSCLGWLEDLLENQKDWYAPECMEIPKEVLFTLLTVDLASSTEPPPSKSGEFLNRFDISYIGMSSFDDVTILCVEDRTLGQRLIWQQRGDEICEALLPPGEVQRIARLAVDGNTMAINELVIIESDS